MANTDSDFVPSSDKVSQTSFSFKTDNISDLRLFLIQLHASFKNQTLENQRLRYEMSDLVKRNDHLEAELFFTLEIKN